MRTVGLLVVFVLLGSTAVYGDTMRAPPSTEAVLDRAVAVYKWFHKNPERSGKEVKTARRLARELRGIGMKVTERVGGHGIVGVLENGPGPVVLYRADMDGLPVAEKTRLPYASTHVGVMHACGHDVHMATAVGALTVLARQPKTWRGTILFVGQPAEETGRGARSILADKKFRRIVARVGKPTVALGIHDDPSIPAGTVALAGGFVNANVDSIDIVIHGRGAHGARPQQGIDPVVIGAEIVMSLQTIVTRRLPPGEPAVVTVGSFRAGAKHNIIPPEATLLLTVRSYSDDTRKTLLDEIRRTANNIAAAHNAPRAPDVVVKDEFTPAAFNDPAVSEALMTTFRRVLGQDRVVDYEPSMGGEDFGRYSRHLGIPGVMWRLGTVDPGLWASTTDKSKIPGLHSDLFAPAPRPTLRTGITTVVAAIKASLE